MIVQCVPNFSEGKDLGKIERIVAPFKNKEGVKLLGVEPDANYNRTVVTVVGQPEAVKNAMVEAVGIALEEIDMNCHTGEHKRMGAIDVIPFIPISKMSVEQAITLSKECAKECYEKFGLPIFLYQQSAQKPDRESLPNIRKGEFEGMAQKLLDPHWLPDFGSNQIHPTGGVTAIGARPALIAYNIDCATLDGDAINQIARSIRFSNGGYRFVQAGPAKMDDYYQVTMNVTDYQKTSVYRPFEAVKMEAKRYGFEVTGSEFIGLVPRLCLQDIAAYYLMKKDLHELDEMDLKELVEVVVTNLKLHGFDETKVIEYHV